MEQGHLLSSEVYQLPILRALNQRPTQRPTLRFETLGFGTEGMSGTSSLNCCTLSWLLYYRHPADAYSVIARHTHLPL